MNKEKWQKNPSEPWNATQLNVGWTNKFRQVVLVDDLGLILQIFLLDADGEKQLKAEGPATRENMLKAFRWLQNGGPFSLDT